MKRVFDRDRVTQTSATVFNCSDKFQDDKANVTGLQKTSVGSYENAINQGLTN